MKPKEIEKLLEIIDSNYSFHDRIKKLAEECSEFTTSYLHYSTRGEAYLKSIFEEIAGVDIVLLTIKQKMQTIPEYKKIYREIFNQQMTKCRHGVALELNLRKSGIEQAE